jgi:aminoglycoside/choline kinase family phosphotransferase
MDTRELALRDWAKQLLKLDGEPRWQAVTGDASTRRYFRLAVEPQSWICVDAPPQTEKSPEFLRAREILAGAGILVPELLGVSEEQGFLLLGDLGQELLLPLLTTESAPVYYAEALDTLFTMQGIALEDGDLPAYSAEILREELQRFPRWFCRELLGVELDGGALEALVKLEERLVESALAQPQVFVHRDYHSRNLMPQADGRLGVIDFQDALLGPVCYDLVSLLRDCYIRWSSWRVREWALAYRQRLLTAQRSPAVTEDDFMRWFDWMGLQRHLKVLGNFARLAVRDGRPQYLRDLPLVLGYIQEVLEHYREFDDFRDLFDARLTPLIRQQAWSEPG